MSIASERGLLCSENKDDAEHPTVIVRAQAELDSELTTMLSQLGAA